MDRDPELGDRGSLEGSQNGSIIVTHQYEKFTANVPDNRDETLSNQHHSLGSGGDRYSFNRSRSMDHEPLHLDDVPTQREEDLSRKLLQHFDEDIFLTGGDAAGDLASPPGKLLIISFAGLQRMRLRKLQSNLANRAMDMHFKTQEPQDWEALLKEYTQAVRDYDFIISCVERPHDPFIMTSMRELEAGILRFELSHVPTELRRAKGGWDMINFADPKQRDGSTRGELTRKARLQGFFGRLAMALFGGVFLVGPMWLMVLDNKRYTSLISTSVFVFAFAIVMAVTLYKETMVTVMSATAAYAAVLVVFVGTTSGSTGITGS